MDHRHNQIRDRHVALGAHGNPFGGVGSRGASWIGGYAAVAALLLLGSGCAGVTQLARRSATVEAPTTVFLVEYERYHHSIAFDTGGVFEEFTYGDWRLYAHHDRAWYQAAWFMTVPSQGTLGRRVVPRHGATLEALCETFHGCVAIHPLRVERARAGALMRRLRETHRAHRASGLYNPLEDTVFVHHDDDYSFRFTCNHALAGWLNRLGFDVEGPLLLANFAHGLPED